MSQLRKDIQTGQRRRVVPAWDISAGDGAPDVTVTVPALSRLGKSLPSAIEWAGDAGILGALTREIGNIEKARAASAADLPGKAAGWEQLARQASDPVQARTYRQLAAGAREQLAHDGDHLKKAVRYEKQAAAMSSAGDRAAYLELARLEREKAGAR